MNYSRKMIKNFILISISWFASIGVITSLLVIDFVPHKFVWIPQVTFILCFLWLMFFNYANFWRRKEKTK